MEGTIELRQPNKDIQSPVLLDSSSKNLETCSVQSFHQFPNPQSFQKKVLHQYARTAKRCFLLRRIEIENEQLLHRSVLLQWKSLIEEIDGDWWRAHEKSSQSRVIRLTNRGRECNDARQADKWSVGTCQAVSKVPKDDQPRADCHTLSDSQTNIQKNWDSQHWRILPF